MKKAPNTIATETVLPVETLLKGEYVRRLNKDGTAQDKTYVRGEYCRFSKKYSLTDTDDVSREVMVKAGTKLLVGFTY